MSLFSACALLYSEEAGLENDLLELCDQDEVDRLLESHRLAVDQLNQGYSQHLEEMDVFFEDVGIRSGRQLALLGRIFGELVNIWRIHYATGSKIPN